MAKLPEPVSSDEEALREAERYWMDQQTLGPVAKSRLSRNLLDILAEQSCICYFVQFLETKSALPLVKFYLEVEGFKSAAAESVRLEERIAKGVGTTVQHRPLNRSVSSDNYDSVSFLSADCDSISTFSENAFEDAGTTTEDLTTSSRSCTPLPILHEETGGKPEDTMRQSLTDDEKLKLEEQPPTTTTTSTTTTTATNPGFNSLVISDAVRIYRKFLVSSSSPYYIEVPATILAAISLALCGGGTTCSERIFDDAQQYLVEVMEKNYLNAFLESGFYCKYTFEVLSSDSLTLRDILCSEMALFYFMEYLEQKGKRHTLEFCVSASHFLRTATSGGGSTTSTTSQQQAAQADAVVLYQKYFSLQATCSLSLSDKVRFLIEEQICSTEVDVIKRCFELPSRIVERFLERQYFQGFLRSPLYAKFLSELVGKIGSNPAEEASGNFGILAGRKQIFTNDRRTAAGGNQRRGHRKTFSDVTSDSTNRAKQQHSPFISSQNTLLAMPDASFHRKRLTTTTSSGGSDLMLIDSRQLYNPDLLWRRNSVAGLTFGRVDALGRYERDFDMAEPPQDDDRWSKNRLKKAMRKLVNLPEDKAQEELAWQVAEMIVKDITSVTMNGGEPPSTDVPSSSS